MATILRLRRTGTTNLATFRLVATDQRCRRDGRFIEILGHYDPRREGQEKLVINTERVQYWLDTGALVSDAVRPLLRAQGMSLPTKAPRKRRTSTASKSSVADTSTVSTPTDAPTSDEN